MKKSKSSKDGGAGKKDVPFRTQASVSQTAGIRWMLDWSSPWQYTGHSVRREVFRSRSEIQLIEIFETEAYGRCLVLDGEVQSFEADEHVYHEALAHPVLLAHPHPETVLIIGGGEGATLREVLRHRSVKRVVMVDCDAEVVDAAKEHLPSFHQGAFEDPRAELVIGDGRGYVEESEESFDVVLVDINNPFEGGPSSRLFTTEFYSHVREHLGPRGAIALQSGGGGIHSLKTLATVVRTVEGVMGAAHPGALYIPSFTMDWSFTVAGPDLDSPLSLTGEDVDRKIEERIEGELRYYDGSGHLRMFHLPRYVREALRSEVPVSQDRQVFVEPFPGYSSKLEP